MFIYLFCYIVTLPVTPLTVTQGYTVTRARLRTVSSIKLTVFICLYVIAYLSCFICEQLFFDPGKVLYLYESIFGKSD